LPDLEATYVALRGQHYGALTAYLPEAVHAHFKPTLRANIAIGVNQPASAIYAAQRNRTALYDIMRRFLNIYDVLAIPVVGLEPGMVEVEYPPFVDGVAIEDYVEWLRWSHHFRRCRCRWDLPPLACTWVFNSSGLRAVRPDCCKWRGQ
jgi:amidase